MATTRISFSYPEEYKEKLQMLAEDSSRTLSSYIQDLFRKHLENKGLIKPKIKNMKRIKKNIKRKKK